MANIESTASYIIDDISIYANASFDKFLDLLFDMKLSAFLVQSSRLNEDEDRVRTVFGAMINSGHC
jgi:hypothetical protein